MVKLSTAGPLKSLGNIRHYRNAGPANLIAQPKIFENSACFVTSYICRVIFLAFCQATSSSNLSTFAISSPSPLSVLSPQSSNHISQPILPGTGADAEGFCNLRTVEHGVCRSSCRGWIIAGTDRLHGNRMVDKTCFLSLLYDLFCKAVPGGGRLARVMVGTPGNLFPT